MHPNRFFLAALTWLAVLIVSPGYAGPDPGTAVAATAATQLRVREATGHNDGPQVQAYLAVVGLRGNWPWCGAFAAWCYRQNGLAIPAGAGGARNWFKAARCVWKLGRQLRPPLPGDLVGFRWSRQDAEDHIEVLEVWGKGPTAACIGGNTSGGRLNRDGQGVYRNWRFKSQIYQVARWAN